MPLFHWEGELGFAHGITYPPLAFEEKKMTFLTGKSGCGKSTLLRLLNRTLLPARGEILFRGRPAGELPVLDYRRQVLLAPQQVFLFDDTIARNFEEYYAMRGEPGITRAEMRDFLSVCCADLFLDSPCAILSGGERQRVFLSIYLSARPQVLLLDEPTAALDEKTARALLGNLKAFCRERGMTVICVCHSSSLVEEFADEEIRLGERE